MMVPRKYHPMDVGLLLIKVSRGIFLWLNWSTEGLLLTKSNERMGQIIYLGGQILKNFLSRGVFLINGIAQSRDSAIWICSRPYFLTTITIQGRKGVERLINRYALDVTNIQEGNRSLLFSIAGTLEDISTFEKHFLILSAIDFC